MTDGIPRIRHIWQSTPWGYQCTPAAHPQRCLIGHIAPVCSAASSTFSRLAMANNRSNDVQSSDCTLTATHLVSPTTWQHKQDTSEQVRGEADLSLLHAVGGQDDAPVTLGSLHHIPQIPP